MNKLTMPVREANCFVAGQTIYFFDGLKPPRDLSVSAELVKLKIVGTAILATGTLVVRAIEDQEMDQPTMSFCGKKVTNWTHYQNGLWGIRIFLASNPFFLLPSEVKRLGAVGKLAPEKLLGFLKPVSGKDLSEKGDVTAFALCALRWVNFWKNHVDE